MSFVDLNNLLIEDLKKIKQNKKHKLKKEFNDYNEQKEKLIIAEINEIMKQRKNLRNKNQRYHQNLYPCSNQNQKHLMIILKSVLKIKRFQMILQVTLKSSRKSDESV